MDSTLKETEFVTPKNKYTIFYYKIPVSGLLRKVGNTFRPGALHKMDSTLKEIEFVTAKNKYTIFYYKILVSFGSPYVYVH